jgi:hypothetical protein
LRDGIDPTAHAVDTVVMQGPSGGASCGETASALVGFVQQAASQINYATAIAVSLIGAAGFLAIRAIDRGTWPAAALAVTGALFACDAVRRGFRGHGNLTLLSFELGQGKAPRPDILEDLRENTIAVSAQTLRGAVVVGGAFAATALGVLGGTISGE